MNEFEFIDTLKKIPLNNSIELGIGDDCAVIQNKLICSDTLVENIHFKLDYFTTEQAIQKSIIVNLSDILAMNGIPEYYLMNLTVPKKRKDLNNISKAIEEINKKYKIDLIGGDTTSSEDLWVISVTMIGKSENPVFRKGAKENDFIYCGGFPGYSSFALNCLLNNIKNYEKYNKYHFLPEIDFNYLKLFKEININSMIDISDGVLNDLRHILKSSNKGAIINKNIFKEKDKDFFDNCKFLNINPFEHILNGGEDFIPLFTSNENPEIVQKTADKYNLNVICIGKITDNTKNIVDENSEILIPKGFIHF
mgnify:CR=1 FL=1